jgi:hypothetical protein
VDTNVIQRAELNQSKRFTTWENQCGFLLGNVIKEVIDE